MKKKWTILISALIMTALLAACGQGASTESPVNGGSGNGYEDENKDLKEKITVATTINPVDQLVKIVGGDHVETFRIVPEGSDAHDFEPTIRDMGRLSEVNLLFENGLGMEPWTEKAKENSGNRDLTLVDLSEGVNLIHLDEEADHDHENEAHDHGEYDPHIWMSLDALIIMAENVKEALIKIMPDGAEDFTANFASFKEEAESLRDTYREKFAGYNGRAFVTGHAAFGYMTREIGLRQMSVEGPFQEGEPTPKRLKDLIGFVKSENIGTIFLEEAASPKVSETLARETGSVTVSINPLEAEGELLESLKETYEKILLSFQE